MSRSLDLSAGSKANFVISYEFSQDNGSTWEKAERSDETVFSKDKSWDGYLNSKDGVKYPGKNYGGDIVPAGVVIESNETKVGERAANIYTAIVAEDAIVMVRTVINITDNFGNEIDIIKFDPVTYTDGEPDNLGIGIYEK